MASPALILTLRSGNWSARMGRELACGHSEKVPELGHQPSCLWAVSCPFVSPCVSCPWRSQVQLGDGALPYQPQLTPKPDRKPGAGGQPRLGEGQCRESQGFWLFAVTEAWTLEAAGVPPLGPWMTILYPSAVGQAVRTPEGGIDELSSLSGSHLLSSQSHLCL